MFRLRVLLLVFAALCTRQALSVFVLPPLQFAANATEDVINQQTNIYHHDTHHATFVKNLNAAVAKYPALQKLSLTQLIQRVGKGMLPADVEVTIRNSGGGHWNHALWWQILAPVNSTNTSRTAISPQLETAIIKAYNSTDAMIAELQRVALARFGSGWAWLVVTNAAKGTVAVTDTPNQDNPLMSKVVTVTGTPILGLDVWEHSYYLRWGPSRAGFVAAFPKVINWAQVSKNYALARFSGAGSVLGAYDMQ